MDYEDREVGTITTKELEEVLGTVKTSLIVDVDHGAGGGAYQLTRITNFKWPT